MRFLMNTLLALIQHRSRFMRSDKTLSLDALGLCCCLRVVCEAWLLASAVSGTAQLQLSSFGTSSILLLEAAATAIYASEIPPCRRLHPIAHGTFPIC
jgi:hypothetical protein